MQKRHLTKYNIYEQNSQQSSNGGKVSQHNEGQMLQTHS